jgi:hypothetical protein
MSSTLTWSSGIQTESAKMPEKAAFEPQNQPPTTKPMLTMTDEQFAKAMFLKAWRKPTPKNASK